MGTRPPGLEPDPGDQRPSSASRRCLGGDGAPTAALVPIPGLFPGPNPRLVPEVLGRGRKSPWDKPAQGLGETKQCLSQSTRKLGQPHAREPRIPMAAAVPPSLPSPGFSGRLPPGYGVPRRRSTRPEVSRCRGRAGGKGLWLWPPTALSSPPRVPPRRPEPASCRRPPRRLEELEARPAPRRGTARPATALTPAEDVVAASSDPPASPRHRGPPGSPLALLLLASAPGPCRSAGSCLRTSGFFSG